MTATLTEETALGHAPGTRRPILTKRNVPYILIAPALLGFLAFKAYPILAAAYISLTTGAGAARSFVGLRNYVRLADDPLFWTSLWNTALILVVQVPIMLFLALLLALGLNSAYVRLRAVWRLGVFLPSLTGLVAYGVMFSVILSRDSGLLNWLLGFLGAPRVDWLGSPFWARISIVIALTWHYTGYNAVIYLAGLQSISKDLYEAAMVDGAGALRRFRSITIPQLRPILLLTVVLSTIGTLQLFDEPFVLTGGGPENTTLTISLYLYQNGFRYFDFGYAAAIAYALTLMVAGFGLLQIKLSGGRK
ncbi:carbohydrate ABC transporter permease [Sphaerisporangium fuscum]|uniref:carbohydrate ABC transporter permease n=1 Tax=Sphaerisporangium fuscum TaxID=2835868 RepID=UPI001BDD9D16|nr:sugar ABC transporter permease [Sphaerisporangium fuscum]